MKGRIHSLQSLGAADGPGLRYIVFMQGCPYRCVYCHNPDTWATDTGEEYTADAIIERVMRCKTYFGKDGGVTVSGGEPLLQAAFVRELFTELHERGIHCVLDSSLMMDGEDARALISEADMILADVKFTDDERVQTLCGGSLAALERNLELAARNEVPVVTRTVIVPGLNDSDTELEGLAAFTKRYPNIVKCELLPFRKFCIEKYRMAGILFPLEQTPEADKAAVKAMEIRLCELRKNI